MIEIGTIFTQNHRRYRVERKRNDNDLFIKEIPSKMMPNPKDSGRWVEMKRTTQASLGLFLREAQA